MDKNVPFRWSVTFPWDVDKNILEIPCDGTSIVIEQIDLDFAQAIAEGMEGNLFKMRTRYVRPDAAPKVTHSARGAVMTLRKDPMYDDKGEIQWDVLEWLVNEQRLEISWGGAVIAIERIDLDFARAIADVMKTGLPEVEVYPPRDVGPHMTHGPRKVVITLRKYPLHPNNR